MRKRAKPSNSLFTPQEQFLWQVWPEAGRTTLVLLVLIIVTLIVFRLFPGLDRAPSWFFYEEKTQFPMAFDPFWNGVREFFYHGQRFVILGAWIWLAYALWRPPRHPLDLAKPMLAAFSAFLGPLLIVNWTLKEFWGRPRPFQTSEFGGEAAYLPPGSIGDACASNCSFVSGEAAAAFWLVWLVILVPARMRKTAMNVLLASAVFTAGLRVAFGRHYISDVMIGGMIGVASITLVAMWLHSEAGRRFIKKRIEGN